MKTSVTVGASSAGVIGVAIFGFCLIYDLMKGRRAWSAKVSGTILMPQPNVICRQTITANGTLTDDLKADQFLWLTRQWKGLNDYFPIAHIDTVTEKAWTLDRAYIGGAKGDSRRIALWIVGPEAHAYLKERMRAQDGFWKAFKGSDTAMNAIALSERWKLSMHFASAWTPSDSKEIAKVNVGCSGDP